MFSKHVLVVVVVAALMAGITGCSDDESSLYIKAFHPTSKIALVVGQEYELSVELNRRVSENTYVDIQNEYQEFIGTTPPETIKFNEEDWKADVIIIGLKSTNSQEMPIVFMIRDSVEKRTFRVKVEDEIVPDASPYDFTVDGGVVPDSDPGTDAVAGDTAAADTSAADTVAADTSAADSAAGDLP